MYLGIGPHHGHTIIKWAGHIANQYFLDGETIDTDSDRVAKRPPFMSTQKHDGRTTRDGHFKNSMRDHPSAATPELIAAENSSFQFLFRIGIVTNFTTVLVFIHPTRERQPVALIRWTVEHAYQLGWTANTPGLVSGTGQMRKGTVTTDPESLASLAGLVTSPRGLLLNQVANPNLMQSVSLPKADGKVFNNGWPADAPANFFTL